MFNRILKFEFMPAEDSFYYTHTPSCVLTHTYTTTLTTVLMPELFCCPFGSSPMIIFVNWYNQLFSIVCSILGSLVPMGALSETGGCDAQPSISAQPFTQGIGATMGSTRVTSCHFTSMSAQISLSHPLGSELPYVGCF